MNISKTLIAGYSLIRHDRCYHHYCIGPKPQPQPQHQTQVVRSTQACDMYARD